eukprot:TRINITY_DN5790_c1_g2_i1.p1 TRINITY_DN5790_c1_g2~~TRINITY_DN5790_c1_g2_i1.p1  ORF type:complete len:542 (+),score=186.64 TRINITY_DN5790_c1_g2_i1:47-1672(+)
MRTLPAVLMMCLSGAALGVVHEKVSAPEGWVRGEAAKDELLEFTFAVKHTAEAKRWLEEKVKEVSTPGGKGYGRYLSLEQLTSKMAVPATNLNTVVSSLEAAGMTNVEVLASKDFVRAYADSATAALYFNTEFCQWSHPVTGKTTTKACSPQYELPEAISPLVDFVAGLVHFPLLNKMTVGQPMMSGLGSLVDTLRTTYNTTGAKPAAGSKTSACFTQFLEQWYSPADLQAFLEHYSPSQKGQTVVKKVGPWQSGHGVEAELDAQYLTGMANGVATWVWSNTNKNAVNNQEPWAQFFTNVSIATDVPNLFSISYGEGENTLTKVYMDRSDMELQKIAARGITVMSASGDNGSGCTKKRFVANFPAALPHITSVGATNTCDKGSGCAGFSSGGFSDYYTRPAWQEAAVSEYLAKKDIIPEASYFNATGRAYPDVAACGNVLICVERVCGMPVAGTSCASPIFTGVLALVSDALIAAGKPALGFVSPALYKAYGTNPKTFTDVTTGSTQGCELQKWKAASGWDATTGLGTPVYSELLAALKAM